MLRSRGGSRSPAVAAASRSNGRRRQDDPLRVHLGHHPAHAGPFQAALHPAAVPAHYVIISSAFKSARLIVHVVVTDV